MVFVGLLRFGFEADGKGPPATWSYRGTRDHAQSFARSNGEPRYKYALFWAISRTDPVGEVVIPLGVRKTA